MRDQRERMQRDLAASDADMEPARQARQTRRPATSPAHASSTPMTARGFRQPEGLDAEFVEFEPVVDTVTIAWLAVRIASASADELRAEVRPLVEHLIVTIRTTTARR